MKSALIILLAIASAAHADVNTARVADGDNVVSMYSGLEHGFVLGGGYGRGVTLFGRTFVVGGDATFGVAAVDTHDYRLRGELLAPIVRYGNWRLFGELQPTWRGTHDAIAEMENLGFDGALHGGHYTRRWFAAAEFGFDFALATHITPSDEYKMTVYPGAKDGWYVAGGGTYRLGVQSGLSIDRYDVIVRAGILRDIDGNKPMVPFYGTVAVAARF